MKPYITINIFSLYTRQTGLINEKIGLAKQRNQTRSIIVIAVRHIETRIGAWMRCLKIKIAKICIELERWLLRRREPACGWGQTCHVPKIGWTFYLHQAGIVFLCCDYFVRDFYARAKRSYFIIVNNLMNLY